MWCRRRPAPRPPVGFLLRQRLQLRLPRHARRERRACRIQLSTQGRDAGPKNPATARTVRSMPSVSSSPSTASTPIRPMDAAPGVLRTPTLSSTRHPTDGSRISRIGPPVGRRSRLTDRPCKSNQRQIGAQARCDVTMISQSRRSH
jgi:hypothetical protein